MSSAFQSNQTPQKTLTQSTSWANFADDRSESTSRRRRILSGAVGIGDSDQELRIKEFDVRKIVFAFAFIIWPAFVALGQSGGDKHDATYYLNLAVKAHAEKNYAGFYENSYALFQLRPNNPNVVYNLACSYGLLGKSDSALCWLGRLADAGYDYGVETDADLASIRGSSGYDSLLQKLELMKKPVNHSQMAFIIREKDLIPENIAYDPATKTFFAGSLYKRKILKVMPDGSRQDFTAEGQDGLWSVLGMKVDAKRRHIWVVTSAENEMKRFQDGELGKKTGLFKYDLRDGHLIRKYLSTDTAHWHLFNDLVLNSQGDAFMTDTFDGSVWVVRANTDSLELLVKPENLAGANGITLSDDEKSLFVAYFSGIVVIDVETGSSKDVSYRVPLTLSYADGLYYYRGSLIAIHTDQHRVSRYFLSNDNTRADSLKVIEAYNPGFDYPTTGVLIDGTLYYIANSQYMSYDNGTIFPFDRLHDVVILKTKL